MPRPTRSSPARARRARSTSARPRGRQGKREELMEQTRRDIEAETRRAIQEIRSEVADLTDPRHREGDPQALDEDDQKRLVEEALGELDFLARRGAPQLAHGGDRPGLRARRCSRSPTSTTSSTRPRPAGRVRRRARRLQRAADVLLLALLLHRGEAGGPGQGGHRGTRRSQLPALLLENHRMPVIFRVRRDYEVLWEDANKLLPSRSRAPSSSTPWSPSASATRSASDRPHRGADEHGRSRSPGWDRRARRELHHRCPPPAPRLENLRKQVVTR